MRRGVFVDDREDHLVPIKHQYITADTDEATRQKAALMIQCFARGWIARRLALRLRERREQKELQAQERENLLMEKQQSEKEAELEKRRNPTQKDHFDTLRAELGEWRKAQQQQINELVAASGGRMTREDKLALEAEVVHKETKLLQRLDKIKSNRAEEDRANLIAAEINKMCTPDMVGGVAVETDNIRPCR